MTTITEMVEEKLRRANLAGWIWSINSSVNVHRALAVIEGNGKRIHAESNNPDAALDEAIKLATKGPTKK